MSSLARPGGPAVIARLARVLWALVLVSLPVTSFRYFPFLGETTYVRPLAIYPLAILWLVLLLEWFRGRRTFPWSPGTVLLLGFVLLAVAATTVGRLLDPIPLHGQSYGDRSFRALITLGVGLSFFLVAAWMSRQEEDAWFSFRWLLAGFGLTLVWSGLQAVTFYTDLLPKLTVTNWQLAFSMRELVRTNRVSGLAYEPAWLAAQIATLYAPVLLGLVLTGRHVTKWRWLELLVLALALLAVMATFSRGGIFVAFVSAGLAFLLAGRHALRSWRDWFSSGLRGGFVALAARLGILMALVAVLVGSFAFLSQKNYFRRLWEARAETIGQYVLAINAGARSAYAAGALAAYQQHPWIGVGLGASGFHIYQNLPDWSLTTVTEIARQLSPENRLFPNPKNMYIRLLAETGIAGFFLFLLYQVTLLGDALRGLAPGNGYRFVAIAGLSSWLAIMLWNLTQDSFASPNLWIIPGIVVGLGAWTAPERS